MIGLLYKVESNTVTYHLQKAFKTGELDENSVARIFRVTASDGKPYNTKHYNLKAIIAVGNKVDSPRAVQFRKWANNFTGQEPLCQALCSANAQYFIWHLPLV
jgi:hypothetical protein